MAEIKETASKYADYFANLSRGNVEDIRPLVTDGLYFKDPFNEITGVDGVIGLFRAMFDEVGEPRFIIREMVCGQHLAFITWDFTCTVKRLGPLKISGASEIRFNSAGKIEAHIDHWDAAGQLYERLPLLGRCLQFIRRHLAHAG